jgi:dsRNA-specific ribonuclease
MKDASFQACVGLHSAGLLNDHFLPLKNERPTEMEEIEELSRIIEISEQFDPWVDVAKRWSLPKLHQTMVTVTKNNGNGEDEVSVRVTTPIAISSPEPFILYWDRNTIFTVRFGMSRPVSVMTPDNLELMREIAHTMIRSTSSNSKPDDRKDFVVLFCPDVKVDHFATWLTANRGTRLALENYHSDHDKLPHGLVRSSLTYGTRYIFKRWCTPSNGAPEEIAVECSPLLRRRNFLLPGNLSGRSIDKSDHEDDSSAQVRTIPASACTIDLLPFEQARVSLFIPACLQHMEVLMVANQLHKTVLKDVPFKDINHVITAISASSAQWVVNYQRFEFLGDSLLKFVISNQLFADHKNWHEGYLSQNRDSLVSNSRLARAALDIGLDPFILTKSFATRRWTVPLISEVKKRAAGRRYISSKVLADVVEALIGAAFVDGGLSEARAWIHTFFPAVSIQPPCFRSIVNDISHNAAQGSLIGKEGESLIGYTFVHKALLTEAFTHGSCERDAVTQSYQRLEFLGDAILDMVVVSQLVEINKDLTHGEMSLIKAAVVNADFLAFLCMEFALKTSAIRIQQTATGKFRETQETKQIELWMFMRHHSQEISRSQVKCQERHQQLRQEISGCLKRGTYHPWTMLAQLNADKFYSDLVESVLGAIFVDSEGDLADCRRFAERIGILPYLRRVVVKGVDVIHPITALDRLKGPEQIEYVVTSQETGHGRYRCQVKICDVEIVAVGGCLGKDEAMTRAADAVLKMTSALTTRSRGGNTDGYLV